MSSKEITLRQKGVMVFFDGWLIKWKRDYKSYDRGLRLQISNSWTAGHSSIPTFINGIYRMD
jgi:hypothetical protein